MSFQQAKSWEERGLQLQAVKDQCNGILKTLGIPDDDARAQGIVHVRQLCNTIAAVPIKLQQNAERPSNIPSILALLGLSNIKDLQSLLHDLNSNSKTSFLTMVQFALENCIVQVIEVIGAKRPSGKFSRDAESIIQLCDIADPERKLELLMLPALLRNTLHANGIHRWPSKTVIVDGEEYVFEKDKRINCGSWSHIFHAVLNSLSVYEEILTSERVRTIQRIPAR